MPMTVPGGAGRDAVAVTVHDGRSSRDAELVDPRSGLGEVLVRFNAAVPYRIGDTVTLPDSSSWPVVTVADRMTLSGAWSQAVTIGDA
jgi:hypothetical protein